MLDMQTRMFSHAYIAGDGKILGERLLQSSFIQRAFLSDAFDILLRRCQLVLLRLLVFKIESFA